MNLKILKVLCVEACKNENKKDIDNIFLDTSYNLLHHACRASTADINLVKLLIENGADVNAFTRGGDLTALHLAAFWGQTEIVKLLINNGAIINTKLNDYISKHLDNTPLGFAFTQKHFEIAQILIENGAIYEGEKEGIKEMIETYGKPNICYL